MLWFKTRKQIQREERERLFAKLKEVWPRGNPTRSLANTPDEDQFYRKVGQNQGRKACWFAVEEAFEMYDKGVVYTILDKEKQSDL